LRHKTRRNIFSRELLLALTIGGFAKGCTAHNKPRALALRHGGFEVAVGDESGKIAVFDATLVVATHEFQAHTAEVLRIAYSCQALLASAGRDGLVRVFDATRDYMLLQTLENHGANVPTTSLAFGIDGRKLVTMGGDATLTLCTLDRSLHVSVTKHRRIRTRPMLATAYDVAVDATAKYVICAGVGSRLDVRSLLTGRRIRSYEVVDAKIVTSDVYRLCVDNAGVHVACCYFNGIVRLFDFYSGTCLATTNGHGDLVTCLTFSGDGTKLLTAGGDGCIHTWGLTSELVRVATERDSELKSVESLKREATELISEAPTWARTCCREEQVATMAFSPAMDKCADKFSPFSVTGDPLSIGTLEDQQSVWQKQESSVSHSSINCFDDQALGLRPSLQQERAALKSRQKGRATTVAVQNMRARLAAMGILRDYTDFHTESHSYASQERHRGSSRKTHEDVISGLKAAVNKAMRSYFELSTTQNGAPYLHCNLGISPTSTAQILSTYRAAFGDARKLLATVEGS
jgi:hypothetical protein